jgi:hypothetical protein
MSVSNNAGGIKTITKIVTFYSDGTFTEYTPSPGVMPPTYPQPNPLTVPYVGPYPYAPYWQNPVTYGGGYGGGGGYPTSETEGRN